VVLSELSLTPPPAPPACPTTSGRSSLTLGRWRERARRPALPAIDLATTRLERLTLFESELRQEGPRHTPLVSVPLRPVAY